MASWAFSADNDRYMRLSRISYLEGNVSYQRTPEVDWSAASINMPLEPGDRIYTGPGGRTEIEFEDNSIVQLAENTDVEILALNEDLVQIRMLVGLATVTASSDLDFEINTPAAAFNTVRKGIYRFEVDENGQSDAIVRTGKIEAANNYFSRSIESRQKIRVRPGTDGNREVMAYDARDAWDEWTDRRSIDSRSNASRSHLPDNVYMGAAELDRYGRWVWAPPYGWAWLPYSVNSYWSPYSVGRWCYRTSFGWTWVSYEPWGWLPYHYGRWYQHSSFGWCWLPGDGFTFNFWSPGLVAFYNGPGWVSWCPLGPGDYYDYRRYHYNRGVYAYQLDRLRGLDRRRQGDYINRNARGAFRTVDIDHFRNSSFNERSVSTRWGHIDQPWRQGTLVRDELPIRPSPGSYRAAPDRRAERPRNEHEKPVVVRNIPPRAELGRDGGNRGQFTRITNPQIPPVQSRWAIGRNGGNSNDGRNGEVGRPEERRAQDENRRGEEPRQNNSRWTGGSETNRPVPENREKAEPQPRRQSGGMITGNSERPSETRREARPDSGDSSTEQSPSRWRYERPAVNTPQRPSVTVTPSESRPEGRNGNARERERVVPQTQPENTAPAKSNPSRWNYQGRTYESPQPPAEVKTPAVPEPSVRERNVGRTFETPQRPSAPEPPSVQGNPSKGHSESRAIPAPQSAPREAGSSQPSRGYSAPSESKGGGSGMGRWGGDSRSGGSEDRGKRRDR